MSKNKQKTPEAERLMRDREYIDKAKASWDVGKQYYAKPFKKMRILDLTDRGRLWQAIGANFPKYQILPDTNFITYIKSNILASIYSVTKSAQVLPTSDNDKDLCEHLNVVLDCLWNTQDVGFYQFQAGERAALTNVGYTQVGWDENLTQGSGQNLVKGTVSFKNIDPQKFMRDPFAVDLDAAQWCCTFEQYTKEVFLSNKKYRDRFKTYLQGGVNIGNVLAEIDAGPDGISKASAKDYYTLVIWWFRNDEGGIDEVHMVNNEFVLCVRKNIKPNMFPIAVLYCNLPAGALIGSSEPAKQMANNIALNLMDSLALTAEYKNQNPPKFISDQSRLNVQAFAKHGSEANRTFVVAGPADKAMHYHQFPPVSNVLPQLKTSLEFGIQNISGIDGRYTGRDTGSIITTGGTEEMLNRVTLIDTPKILMYERYCKRLTQLVLGNMIEFCPERKFFRKKPGKPSEYETVSVDFPHLDSETLFNYQIAVSSDLPKNKQRIAAAATELLQAQAQYRKEGDSVNWITEEEWLELQDLPFKERMLERMGIQRHENALEETAQVLYTYADLAQQGIPNDQAMEATAYALEQSRQGMAPPMNELGPNPDLQQMANGAGAPAPM